MTARVRALRWAMALPLWLGLGATHCSSSTPDATDASPQVLGDSGTNHVADGGGSNVAEAGGDAGDASDAAVAKAPSAVPYTNPVLNRDFPDPAAIRAADGAFHAFATGGLLQHATSKDLVHWTMTTEALGQKPSWANQKNNFWAPDVIERDGTFYLYFGAEQNTGTGSYCVGVATSTSLDVPFTDVGTPIVCSDNFEAIDPKAYDDPSGKKLLYWGSASDPIHVRELAPSRTEFAVGSSTQDVISSSKLPYETLVEGAWLHARDGYAYLFYSGDNCCGDNAHYAVMVARATNALGPFLPLTTTSVSDNTILVANDTWNAPGHNAIVTDDMGDDWMLYHAIDRAAPAGRKLLLDKITYVNGWPTIAGKSPSTTEQSGPMLVP
jgi:arabinan endo-1,5-alpha-L-arabinosidase